MFWSAIWRLEIILDSYDNHISARIYKEGKDTFDDLLSKTTIPKKTKLAGATFPPVGLL